MEAITKTIKDTLQIDDIPDEEPLTVPTKENKPQKDSQGTKDKRKAEMILPDKKTIQPANKGTR